MTGTPKPLTLVEGQRSRRSNWVGAAEKFPVVPEGDMLRKNINESSEPVVGCLGLCE